MTLGDPGEPVEGSQDDRSAARLAEAMAPYALATGMARLDGEVFLMGADDKNGFPQDE